MILVYLISEITTCWYIRKYWFILILAGLELGYVIFRFFAHAHQYLIGPLPPLGHRLV